MNDYLTSFLSEHPGNALAYSTAATCDQGASPVGA